MVQYEGFDKNIEAKILWQYVVYTVTWRGMLIFIRKSLSPYTYFGIELYSWPLFGVHPMASCISPLFFLRYFLFLLQKEWVSINNFIPHLEPCATVSSHQVEDWVDVIAYINCLCMPKTNIL